MLLDNVREWPIGPAHFADPMVVCDSFTNAKTSRRDLAQRYVIMRHDVRVRADGLWV